MHFTNNNIYGVGAATGGLERDRNILEFFKYLQKLSGIMPNLQTTNQYWKCICVCVREVAPQSLPLVYTSVTFII